MRSGTLAPHLVVGLGEASQIALDEMAYDQRHVTRLKERLLGRLQKEIPSIFINGSLTERYDGNLNISFAYVEGESLIMAIKDVALSSGSACTSASLEPSYVLRAIGVDEELSHTSLRIGFGRFTTEAEIDYAASLLKKEVEKLREMSPLWEMVNEGIDIKSI